MQEINDNEGGLAEQKEEEQIEEEALARTILDKLTLIGDEPGGGLYEFDKDLASFSGKPNA